jgi:hypothetical protein
VFYAPFPITRSRNEFAALDFLSHVELAQIHRLLTDYARKDDDSDGDWDDFGEPGEDFPPIPGRQISFTARQLQKKYWHARDFGFPTNYTPTNAQKFGEMLRNFINNPATEQQAGTWRGDSAIHYLNRETGMNVVTYPDGTYWTNFKLEREKLSYWPNIGGG